MPWWAWAATIGGIAVLVAADARHARRPCAPGFADAVAWAVIYVGAAAIFGLALYLFVPGETGSAFAAGYLIEKSLSVDNLFVFAVVLGRFAVPEAYRQRVLLIGLQAALLLRAAFIAAGAAITQRFAVSFAVFGVALIYTAFHLLRSSQPKSDPADSLAVRVIRRVMPVTDDYRGMALLTRVQGRLAATPLLIVIAAIVSVDIVFAMDSIPAIFGISQDAYVVFCANAFALLGLRALYFLIAGLLDRVAHLHFGLSAILGFIGMKLLMHFFHAIWPAVPEVSTGISLLVVATVLAVTCASSLLARRIGTRQTAGAVSAAPSPGPPSTNRVPGPTFAPSELQVGRNGVHRSVARWTSDRHNDEAPT